MMLFCTETQGFFLKLALVGPVRSFPARSIFSLGKNVPSSLDEINSGVAHVTRAACHGKSNPLMEKAQH